MDVRTRMKDIRKAAGAVALAATAGFSALGQSPAPSQPKALNLPPSPPAVTKFYPLNEVHRGQQGVAYTVFEGTKPEPMGIEILGVLHNAIGPRQDMILARLEGTKPEYTGVVAGMSGSPVYIDGKLVGALAYRIGQFSKEPICGITPIGQMLGVETAGTELSGDSKDQGTELTAEGTDGSLQRTAFSGRGTAVSAPGAGAGVMG